MQARAEELAAGPDRRPGGGRPGDRRGGRELPQLRRGGPARGRAAGRAQGRTRRARDRARSSTPTSTTWAGCSSWARRSGGSGTGRAPTIVAMAQLIDPEVRALRGRAHDGRRPATWRRSTPRPGRTSSLGDDGGSPGGPFPRDAGVRHPGHHGPRDRDLHRLLVHRHGGRSAARTAPSSRSRSTPTTPQVARGNIAAAGLESHISVIEGPALRSLEELQGPFDLVFIDADKVSYDAYFEAVLPKLAPHGLIVVDNTLQGGGVLAVGEAPARGGAGAARLQRQGGQRPACRVRAHHHPRRRDADPPGRGWLRPPRCGAPDRWRRADGCSTTTSTSGRTTSTRRRCASSSWPSTARGPRRPG